MLEYLSIKKYKKYKEEKEKREQQEKGKPKEASAADSNAKPSVLTLPKPDPKPVEAPILDADDESFFERLTSGNVSVNELDDDDGERPPLPPRVATPDLSWDSDSESFVRTPTDKEDAKGKGESKKKGSNAADKIGRRISLLVRRTNTATKKEVKPTNLAVPEPEVDKEKDDLARVLDNLNLSARNNRAFSMSTESTELVRKFTVVLKDLVNGVPTAVDDLHRLLDDPNGTLARSFDKLPNSIKKLVMQLPTKLTSTLAPEILAVAAESQGIKHEDSSGAGLKSTAKSLLVPKNLAELVTKPGAIISMLKAIMNALKVRWPAFIGTNVLWSVALFGRFT